MPRTPSTVEVLERLRILLGKLNAEGMYVRANTVGLAIDEIEWLELELKAASRRYPLSHLHR